MKEEGNNQLAFLDVLVCRKDCGGLKTKLFRKATNTMQVLNFSSNHPISHKRSCVRTLYRRVETHCSEPEDKIAELQYLRRVFKANGYPRNFVNRCICKRDERHNRQSLASASICQERFGSCWPPSRTTWGWSCTQTGGNHQASANETERPTATAKKRPQSFMGSGAVADKATTSEKPEDKSKREWPNTLQRCGEMTLALELRLSRQVPATQSNLARPKFSQELTTA
ncbi:hypothetical protein SprV_0802561700 [Sparganum proliferum]